jgi:hypothetical protein
MANPAIEELQESDRYELVYQLEHHQVKEFVIRQITSGSRIIRWFMIYQFLMIVLGLFFITRSIVLAFERNHVPLFYTLCAVVFSFTLLILIHELLHALAFKVTGAPRVSMGAYLKKFIFYAEADRHVLNRKQFTLVALTPFIAVKLATLAAVLLTVGQPAVCFWIFIMCGHSLFCAGDIGMLDYFYSFKDAELYTFDVRKEKKSYFYLKKDEPSED